jgi:monothiol glutaredoxin
METPQITAYLKTSCGWSNGVRAILGKYSLSYEEKDILKNPEFRAEMEQRSGQRLSPCVVVDGRMLPDVSGEELEHWLIANNLVEASDAPVEVPINSSCQNKKQHVA